MRVVERESANWCFVLEAIEGWDCGSLQERLEVLQAETDEGMAAIAELVRRVIATRG